MNRITITTLTCIFSLLYSLPVRAQVTFQSVTSVSLQDTPQELAKGDFNNDGLTDFVVCNFNALANKQITILLNTGTGTFTGSNVKNFAASTNVLDVATGDFNEDGKLDVIACSQPNKNFSLLLGDGAGNLGAPTNFNAGDVPEGIATGDLNKDNHLDVIVSNRGTPSDVYIFLGNGAGGFTAPTIIAIANLTDVSIADFNNDTNPDFAVSAASSVQIWIGNGTGTTFTPGPTISGFVSGEDVIAADLDGDLDRDILAGGGYSLNDGAGNFAARIPLLQTGYEYTVADLNKDGDPDIVAADHNQNYTNMRVFLGDGVGFTLLAKFESNIYFQGVEVADVNNDFNPDVVGVGSWSSAYRADIFLGDGTGYFNTITKYPVATDPRGMAKGDFNNDGILDIALAHSAGNFVSTYLGLGQGRFAKTSGNPATGTLPEELLTFDYNKDNNLDLITFNFTTPSVTILTGNGTGSFTPLTTIALTANSQGMALADFNNDSHIDIAIAGGTNNAVYLLTGTGSGFNAATTIPLSGVVEDVEAADFNGDSNQDLAAAFSGPDNFLALTGNGAGTFTEGTKFSVTGTGAPGNIRIADFNNDGKPDVAVSGSNTEEYFFTNNGVGSFTSFKLPTTSGSSLGKDFVDMNGDGIIDAVFGAQNSGSSETGSIRAFRGVGDGTFTTSLFNKQSSGGNRFITHDFNADGKMDIASTSFNMYEDYLGVLINTTGPACTPPTISSLSPNTTTCPGSLVAFSVAAAGTAPLTYQWKKNSVDISGATSSTFNISAVTTADAGTYTVAIANGCGSITSSSIVLTVGAISPPTASDVSRCGPGTLVLTASGSTNGNYRWYDVATGGSPISGEVNSTFTTPSLAATVSYFVSINNGTCESSRTAVSATINFIPAKPGLTSNITPVSGTITICGSMGVVLSAPSGFSAYSWSDGSTSQQIAISSAGTYSVQVTDGNNCTSTSSDPMTVVIDPVVCNAAPSIVNPLVIAQIQGQVSINLSEIISDPDNNLDLTTLKVVSPPISGATAIIDTDFTLTLDYAGLAFSGSDKITIEVCDMLNSCSQAELTIEVLGEIEIYNAVSPNGDNLNDVFLIRHIEFLENTGNNRVTIFNRWGDKVFEVDDYDNSLRVFKGLNNNGDELPSGTYFYRLDFSGDRKSQQGYLVLKR